MMDEYWATLLERYAKYIREGKVVRQIHFSCAPVDEVSKSRFITIELEVLSEEAQAVIV